MTFLGTLKFLNNLTATDVFNADSSTSLLCITIEIYCMKQKYGSKHCFNLVGSNSIWSFFHKRESSIFDFYRYWKVHYKSIYLINIKVMPSTKKKWKLILTFILVLGQTEVWLFAKAEFGFHITCIKIKFNFLIRNILSFWSGSFYRRV